MVIVDWYILSVQIDLLKINKIMYTQTLMAVIDQD